MKNKIFLVFPLFILFINFSSYCRNLTISNDKPNEGDLIEILYHGSLSKKNTKLYCVLFFKDFSKVTKTLETNIKENKIKSTLIIPDSVAYFIFYLVNRSEIDNNLGQGYGFHVYDRNIPIKSSFLIKGYNNKYYDYLFKGNIDYKVAAKNIEKEWQLYPEMENKCIPYYLGVLLKIPDKKNEALGKIKEKLELLKSLAF